MYIHEQKIPLGGFRHCFRPEKQKLLQKVGVKFMCTTRNSKWKFNYLMFLTYIEHTYLYLV